MDPAPIATAGSSEPLVTIGIPFLNAAPTLLEAIRSVFAQTESRWRLLLVDDGSTDASVTVARRVADPRVQVWSDGRTRGLPFRLNQVVQLTATPFVARMDADDLMHPRRLERQISALLDAPRLDLVGSATYTMTAAGEAVGIRGEGTPEASLRAILSGHTLVHPSVTARTAWMRAHPYSEVYPRAEDAALWCEARHDLHVLALPEPLHFYREPVPIDVTAHARSCRSLRSLIRHFGPEEIPALGRLRLRVRSHLSTWAYRLAGPLGGHAFLVRQRSRALVGDERREALAALAAIAATTVPGVDR